MLTYQTNAVLVTEPRKASITDFDMPRSIGSTLLVRVELCGICTPEQRVYRGAKPVYPYWGGHELCGIVEEVSGESAASQFSPGTRVAIALMPRCGHCFACRSGLDNHCAYLAPQTPSKSTLPAGPRGFSSMLEIDPAQAFACPAHVPAESAALNEPVACCLRSIEQAKPKPGDLVSVFGCGTMGRLHAALLLQRGCRVIMVDDDGLSRSAAAQIGGLAAEPVAMRDAPMLIRRLSDVDGAQTAFCTRGGAAAASMAIETSARGGRVILFQSLQADREVRLDLNDLHYREITVTGTIAQSAKDFAAARTLLAHETAIRDALTIETVPATEANRAFARSLALDVNRVMIDFR